MILHNFSTFVLGLIFFIGTACTAAETYETDPAKLPPGKRALYLQAKKTLNDWTGEHAKLTAASAMIDSFIKSDPTFLPIHIEKARWAIMTGTEGKNDFAKFNREALAIVLELQRKAPAYAKPYVLAGHIYMNINELANARKSLEQASRLQTNDPWLYLNWCDLLMRTKEYDAAMAYATKGLIASADDGKAMVSAIYFLGSNGDASIASPSSQQVAALVFAAVKDPLQRLRIADRLTAAYSGDARLLAYAYDLIMLQKKETPQLRETDLSLAEWFLEKGYLVTTNQVATYDKQFSAAAARLLDQLPDKPSMKNRIFNARFLIATSDQDLNKARTLIERARASGVTQDRLLTAQARLMWLAHDYAGVIAVYDELARLDPTYDDELLQMAAYAQLGDNNKLEAYHRRQVERNPTSAWTLGNYAGFLLDSGQYFHAVDFGEKALAEMPYPVAQDTTAIAHLLVAGILAQTGDKDKAATNVARALELGFDRERLARQCKQYCASIDELLLKNRKRSLNFKTATSAATKRQAAHLAATM